MPKVMSWPRMLLQVAATWFGVRPARSARRVRRRRSTSLGALAPAPPARRRVRCTRSSPRRSRARAPRRRSAARRGRRATAAGRRRAARAAFAPSTRNDSLRRWILTSNAAAIVRRCSSRLPAEVGEAGVVGRDEGVAKDHGGGRGVKRDCRSTYRAISPSAAGRTRAAGEAPAQSAAMRACFVTAVAARGTAAVRRLLLVLALGLLAPASWAAPATITLDTALVVAAPGPRRRRRIRSRCPTTGR